MPASGPFPRLPFRPLLLVGGLILAAGCTSDPSPAAPPTTTTPAAKPAPARPADNLPQADDWFDDVTPDTGIDFAYRNGREGELYTILETVGGGAALFDFDRDGDLDLYITGGGKIAADGVFGLQGKLFRNDGDWKFTDVTAEAGLDVDLDYGHGAFSGDFDSDGRPDLYVTCYGRSRLFRNRDDGTFEDVTLAAGLDFGIWSTAAAWLDFNNDGHLDLFVTGYVEWKLDPKEQCPTADGSLDTCPPQKYPAAADRLFRNRGDGTFEDVSAATGIRTDGKGLGALAADFNADGHVDLYVANDQVENHLYLNDGQGRFSETGQTAGVAVNEFGAPEGSMGVDAADVNGDGLPELVVTNFELEDNSLYQNRGKGLFEHATVRWGLGGKCRPLVGFGTALADFDLDGFPDLLVVNGHVSYRRGIQPWEQSPALFRNLAGKRFEEVTAQAGIWFRSPHAARGLAVGDLDNDGALDLVVVSQNEPVTLLRNRKVPAAWVRLELTGSTASADAIGASVTLEQGSTRRTQFVKSGAGYLSSFDSRLLFSLPAADNTSDAPRVTVRWPGGESERFDGIPLRQTHRIVQGHGTKIEIEAAPTPPGD